MYDDDDYDDDDGPDADLIDEANEAIIEGHDRDNDSYEEFDRDVDPFMGF